MKNTILSLLAVGALGAALTGCVVQPVDGVSVGYHRGVVLHTPDQPVVVAPPPPRHEHDHEYSEYHERY